MEHLVDRLEGSLRGRVVVPGDHEYGAARKVYNGMIDRRPAAIARCADEADVGKAVQIAAADEMLIAVRGGGHNAGGLGVCDDGVVVDLSEMRRIVINPQARTASIEGGCTWGEVDVATNPYGLA